MAVSNITIYESTWWSVKLPAGWTASSEKECVTFRATSPLGALQISSARKNAGPVQDDELIEFAKERQVSRPQLSSVTYQCFSGFMAERKIDGLAWKEWWLRSGDTMLYVSYTVVPPFTDSEMADVEAILRSASAK
jgi:hypothetical protein